MFRGWNDVVCVFICWNFEHYSSAAANNGAQWWGSISISSTLKIKFETDVAIRR